MSKRIQATVSDEIFKLLEKIADNKNISKSAVISLALQEYASKNLEGKGGSAK